MRHFLQQPVVSSHAHLGTVLCHYTGERFQFFLALGALCSLCLGQSLQIGTQGIPIILPLAPKRRYGFTRLNLVSDQPVYITGDTVQTPQLTSNLQLPGNMGGIPGIGAERATAHRQDQGQRRYPPRVRHGNLAHP